MTQSPAPPPDRGLLRSAIEGLLRTCVDLERQTEAAAAELPARMRRVTGQLAGVRLAPQVLDVAGLVQSIDGLGRQLETDLRERLADARRPYVTEIQALLGLLAPWHGLTSLPPLAPTPSGASLGAHFPAGFAHDYVDHLLASVDASVTLTAGDVPARTGSDIDAAKERVGDELPDDLRAEGLAMLRSDHCHAVERHGPQVTAESQLARLVWLKDPADQEVWRVLPDGAVESDHRCGPISGGFTSPEAMAKPLEALLIWAHGHAGGVNELINRHTKPKTKRISIHVDAESAGLEVGDATAFRGTATVDRAMTDDWLDARDHAMTHGTPPVYAVAYDPIAEGSDPGAFLHFKRVGPASWKLVTCYPVGQPNPNTKRLEDLT